MWTKEWFFELMHKYDCGELTTEQVWDYVDLHSSASNDGKPPNVSSNASNGFRPNVYIPDDLEDLKRRYTPEQIKKMWEDVYPKLSEISGKVIIITGTPK